MPPRPLPWKLLPASQAPGGRRLRQSWWVEWSAFTLILGKEISRKPLCLPAGRKGGVLGQARPLGEGGCGKAGWWNEVPLPLFLERKAAGRRYSLPPAALEASSGKPGPWGKELAAKLVGGMECLYPYSWKGNQPDTARPPRPLPSRILPASQAPGEGASRKASGGRGVPSRLLREKQTAV